MVTHYYQTLIPQGHQDATKDVHRLSGEKTVHNNKKKKSEPHQFFQSTSHHRDSLKREESSSPQQQCVSAYYYDNRGGSSAFEPDYNVRDTRTPSSLLAVSSDDNNGNSISQIVPSTSPII